MLGGRRSNLCDLSVEAGVQSVNLWWMGKVMGRYGIVKNTADYLTALIPNEVNKKGFVSHHKALFLLWF